MCTTTEGNAADNTAGNAPGAGEGATRGEMEWVDGEDAQTGAVNTAGARGVWGVCAPVRAAGRHVCNARIGGARLCCATHVPALAAKWPGHAVGEAGGNAGDSGQHIGQGR